jgi:hypothetical protein
MDSMDKFNRTGFVERMNAGGNDLAAKAARVTEGMAADARRRRDAERATIAGARWGKRGVVIAVISLAVSIAALVVAIAAA